jgi:hypothetical protein
MIYKEIIRRCRSKEDRHKKKGQTMIYKEIIRSVDQRRIDTRKKDKQ